MPEAFDLTSTLVMGWIWPVATTERATSPRVTLAILLGSMGSPLARCTSAITAPIARTAATQPRMIQSFLLLRDAAMWASHSFEERTALNPGDRENRSEKARQLSGRTPIEESINSSDGVLAPL